jgi:iron complex transport system substrate-binding protein
MLRLSLLALFAATPALAQEFPLTLDTAFGQTIIPAAPERVATIDYNGADNLLALGVQPVLVRYWFGDYPRAVWPWADALLTDTPEILKGEINFEQIAASDPDVIMALYSGITAEDYAKLSQIAPVVAIPAGVGPYELPWRDQALIAGRALGRETEAGAQVAAIEARLTAIATAHPEWADSTVTLGTVWSDKPNVYAPGDPRVQLLNDLGLQNNPALVALATPGSFYIELSEEQPEPFDSDLLLWFADEGVPPIEALAFRPKLAAAQEGREVFLGPLMTSALSHTSLLSLPYALDRLEPLIADALDGNGVAPDARITE